MNLHSFIAADVVNDTLLTPERVSEAVAHLARPHFKVFLLLSLAAEAQSQLASATEKERQASEKVLELNMRLASLESQVPGLRQERSRLQAQLEMERAKVEVLEESKQKLVICSTEQERIQCSATERLHDFERGRMFGVFKNRNWFKLYYSEVQF